jgi:ATP-dependent phosphoenolpyruvate carboxykinase
VELLVRHSNQVTASGALVTDSGAKKGRSPRDKRIVDEPSTSGDVWVPQSNTSGAQSTSRWSHTHSW